MSRLIALFWILSQNGLITLYNKKRSESNYPLVFICGVFLLYVAGFFTQLQLDYLLSWITVLLFWIRLAVLFWKKDEERLIEFRDNFLTIGNAVFVLLFLYICQKYKYTFFRYWDEFSHWGPMVRESIRYNTFYSTAASNLYIHKDYPPFFPLLNVLFCDLFGGEYAENRLYIAQNTFMLSLFVTPLAHLKQKNAKDWGAALLYVLIFLLCAFTVQLTPDSSDSAVVYRSVYVDWPMALFGAYTIYLVCFGIRENKIADLFAAGACIFTLLCMKQMGYILAFMAVVIFLIQRHLVEKQPLRLSYLALLLCPVFLRFVWKFYCDAIRVSGDAQFLPLDLIQKSISLISGQWQLEGWQTEAFQNYMKAISTRPLMVFPVSLSYYPIALIITLGMALLLRKRKQLYVALLYLLGSIAYSVVMLLLYMFPFGPFEGPTLASFNRYLFSYLYLGICFVVLLGGEILLERKEHRFLSLTVLLACFILFADYRLYPDLLPEKRSEPKDSEAFEEVLEHVNYYDGKKILAIEQYNKINLLQIKLIYYGVPKERVRFLRLENGEQRLGISAEMSFEEWKELLREYDLLYLEFADSYFIENYWEKLTEENLYNNSFYEITDNNGTPDVKVLSILEELK